MRQLLGLALLLFLTALAAHAQPASTAPADRRERKEPGLVLETPGRMAACDVLTFVREGKDLYLLAAGDDKVVIVWQVVNGKLVEKRRLRWGIWREQLGSIYALTTFRQGGALKVAVAGWGRLVGQVVVFDFATGKIERFTPNVVGNHFANWSLTASPSGSHLAWGNDAGEVWAWDLKAKTGGVTRVGVHPTFRENSANRVHFVDYLSERQLVSVAFDGSVLQWDASQPGRPARELFRLKVPKPRNVVLSPDQKWLAAVGDSPAVEIRTFPGGELKDAWRLHELDLPQCISVDPSGRLLSVGIRHRADAPFLHEIAGEAVIYDVSMKPAAAGVSMKVSQTPERIAFSPDGGYAAVAGGSDYEVSLWDLRPFRKLDSVRSPGSSLWKVAFSEDGNQLGFQDRRADVPKDVNHRGAPVRDGMPYRVFDLKRRAWAFQPEKFKPVEPIKVQSEWRVKFHPTDPTKWYAVSPENQPYQLDLSFDFDEFPRCYTFLPRIAGRPVQLAVGHYWGFSLFDMAPKPGAKLLERVRLYHGHQGYVTSIAPSANGKLIVTGSRDQTITGWSLADWPSQSELGVSFRVNGSKLIVTNVDAGSPSWQAGLAKDDEVTLLESERGGPAPGGPTKWLETFRDTRGLRRTMHFTYRHLGGPPQKTLMSVRQRPLWRFFATREDQGREWVLWRWHDYFYDASTRGDAFLGWQISGEQADEAPVFYPATHFEERFRRPARVGDLLTRALPNPDRVLFREIEPPSVTLRVSKTEAKEEDITVDITALPVGPGVLQQLDHVELWVNTHRFKVWSKADLNNQGQLTVRNWKVPQSVLRRDANEIRAQAFNAAQGMAEDRETVRYATAKRKEKPTLYGLAVGITNYKSSKPQQIDLVAARPDAVAIHQILMAQKKTGLYDRVEIAPLVADLQASPKAILSQLQSLTKVADPEDQFVLFLAGHGLDSDVLKGNKSATGLAEEFYFAGPYFDLDRPADTSLTGRAIYNELAKINCHKLVFLDACRSGNLRENPLRELYRNGIGPVVVMACEPRETALEVTSLGHGLFTLILIEAMRDLKADAGSDGVVDLSELTQYVVRRVPARLKELQSDKKLLSRLDEESKKILLEHTQTPQVAPGSGEIREERRRLVGRQ